MYNYKKASLSILIVAVMVLSSFMAIMPLTNAASSQTSSTPVGTVTLNPSSGAFPGQLVTYTWSGVPLNLVAPVYVTVYLNGAPYSTGVASYSNGVLTGTFTMPNDQPGTSFQVSLSYKDSAQNYGVSAQMSSTGSANIYTSPVGAHNTELNTNFGIPYTITASVNYSKNSKVETNFTGGSSTAKVVANATSNVTSGNKKTRVWAANESASAKLGVLTNFTNYENFISVDKEQNITFGATAYQAGTTQLSLAASTVFKSNFTGQWNNTGKLSTSGSIVHVPANLTKITLIGYVNQTINNVPTDFLVTAVYSGMVYSNTTYTTTGTFSAVSPTGLKGNFSGTSSVTWSFKNINITKTTGGVYYFNVTYNLNVKMSGSTGNSLVSISATYSNSTYLNFVDYKGASKPKSVANTSADTLPVQSGYTFTGYEVGLENPTLSGTFINDFQAHVGKASTGNISFKFSNGTKGSLITLGVNGTKIYFNQTGKTAIVINNVFNQTLTGYLNVTIVSNFYSAGITYISQGVWNFTATVEYNLTAKHGIYISNVSKISNYGNVTVSNSNATAVGTGPTGTTMLIDDYYNVIPYQTFNLKSKLHDMAGYPYLTSFKVPYTTYELMYNLYPYASNETATITQNLSWTGNLNITFGAKSGTKSEYVMTDEGLNSTVTGFNTSLSIKGPAKGINFNVTVLGTNVTFYGLLSQSSGNLTALVSANSSTGGAKFSNNIIEYYYANFTYPKPALVTFTNSYKAVTTNTVTNDTNVSFSLADVFANITYFNILSGSVTFTSSFYHGSILINGHSNSSKKISLGLWTPNNATKKSLPGNVTSIIGFRNTTLLGWYNASLRNYKTLPALYGINSFNGSAEIYVNVSIKNYTQKSAFMIDPSYNGLQNVTLSLTILSNVTASTMGKDNQTYSLSNNSQNLTVKGIGKNGYLNNFDMKGTFSVTDSTYGLTNTYSMNVTIKQIPFFDKTAISFKKSKGANITFVSGDVLTPSNTSYMKMYANISSPIANLTLTPLANFTFNGSFELVNSTTPYNISGTFTGNTVSIFNSANNTIFSTTGTASALATIKATVLESQMVIQGTSFGITYTTNSVNIATAGNVPVSGLATSQSGSGTVSGTIKVAKIYPLNKTTYASSFDLAGQFNVQVSFANGTQEYLTGSFLNSPVSTSANMSELVPVQVNTGASIYSEMPNTGVSSGMSYQLLDGSGAMIITLSNNQIAEIATLSGQYVNMSLSQLNAKISSVWNEQNNTYVTLTTDYGTMTAQLKALNATLLTVKNGEATIQTSVGTIQTSLTSINGQITSINGSMATVQTSLGKIQTSLNSLNTTVTSINGNVATVQTSLGTLTGTVTSINNGVATIQTNLGTLQTSVSGVTGKVGTVSSSVGNTMIFEVVVLILVLITLVLAFLAMSNSNKLAKKIDEMKKQ